MATKRGFLSRRAQLGASFARRLFFLFVAAAMLPLAMSDGLSGIAVGHLIDDNYARDQGLRTGQVSRQVFDRLMTGKTLLSTFFNYDIDGTGTDVRRSPPGVPVVFRSVARLAADGSLVWASDPGAALDSAWRSSATPMVQSGSAAEPSTPQGIQVSVRVVAASPPRILMGARGDQGATWVAELAPDFIWSPIYDANGSSAWRVADVGGQTIIRFDADGLMKGQAGNGAAPDTDLLHSERALFLRAEFRAPDWRFEQWSRRPRALWLGAELRYWLALVAAGTLLSITLVISWQIRRTLVPLEKLRQGTQRLAAGDSHTRVHVEGEDEFSELAGAFNDMAGRIESQLASLGELATHDSLTGLANRSGLHDFLDSSLRVPAASDSASTGQVALLFIDLDHFKGINDALGHEAGDELLRLAAQRLLKSMPAGSMLARPGGDEFVAVVPQCDEVQASSLAALIVQRLAQPFELRGTQRLLGASVGIAVAPHHGHQRDTLMRRADMAMYAAKESGRSRFALFSANMDTLANDRLRIQSELPGAILKGELVAYFQARVQPMDLSVTSAEALVRWRHPELGLLTPGAFLGYAEDSNLIIQLGDWMLNESVAQIARWHAMGARIGRVSVNISNRQLMEGLLIEKVRAVLERHGLPPHCLELEVTESVMIGDSDRAGRQLAQLRALGVTIAMDDFGTGYSSMASLRDLPIDVMKIDRAFVKDLDSIGTRRQAALAIARAIVAMAQSMNVKLVAEGIETPEQAEILRSLGCDELQGFLYARPEPAAGLEARLFAASASQGIG